MTLINDFLAKTDGFIQARPPDVAPHAIGFSPFSPREIIVRAGEDLKISVPFVGSPLPEVTFAKDGIDIKQMRVDGGMAANNWFIQFLADILDVEIDRPKTIETSALGAAYLAGLQAGIYDSLDHIASLWQADTSLTPQMSNEQRDSLLAGWQDAVKRVLMK